MAVDQTVDQAISVPQSGVATTSSGLRRNYLSLVEVIAMAIGVIAPSVMPALAMPDQFGAAGAGSWLGYVFATIALVLMSLNINEFSKREASPGSLYIVAAKGLGPIWGVISGWSLLIGYVFTCSAVISGAANYLLILFHQPKIDAGGLAPTIVFSVVVTGIAWFLAYRDIKLSTRATLLVECITVLLILFIVAAALSARGTSSTRTNSNLPAPAPARSVWAWCSRSSASSASRLRLSSEPRRGVLSGPCPGP